jgi:inorganic pyrophosphatase
MGAFVVRVFIENEAGSRRKNTYDETTLRYLHSADVSAAYPYPYGFVPGTRGEDGDAVDCFVLTSAPLRSGAIVECEPIGLIEQIEDGEIDHKVLAVLPGETADLDGAVARITAFVMTVFAHIPGKDMRVGPLRDAAAARDYVARCAVP